jgi:glyceraldehyde 3-phosphate dehydrogenase
MAYHWVVFQMAKKIGINGFGRMGRILVRLAIQEHDLQVVGINDIIEPKVAAHLFKYDTTFGRFQGTVVAKERSIVINDKEIPFTAIKEPDKIPWNDYGAEIIYESTGAFTKKDGFSKHLAQPSVRVVLVSAPAEGVDATLVYGVNHDTYKKGVHRAISGASCTTNCLAPICMVLQDSFGIKRGLMNTIHAYTNDQRILDFPHKDLRRARAAAMNIIPTTTGAAKAIGEVIPALKGKMDGVALRVPVADGSMVDLTCELERPATKEEINAAMKRASEGALKGVLGYNEDPIVSSDIIGSTFPSMFDSLLTSVIDKNFVKVFAWYDNEYGFSCQAIRLMAKVL